MRNVGLGNSHTFIASRTLASSTGGGDEPPCLCPAGDLLSAGRIWPPGGAPRLSMTAAQITEVAEVFEIVNASGRSSKSIFYRLANIQRKLQNLNGNI